MRVANLKELLFFLRKFIPILNKYPPKYIFEPWKAPLSVQKAAGCIIGKDYPKPIVVHEEAVKINKAKMKNAREKQYGGTTDQGTNLINTIPQFISILL